MKAQSLCFAALFAVVSTLSIGAHAADAESAPAAKTAAQKMKPHSHMEEKTGIAPKTPDAADSGTDKAKQGKAKPGTDKSKHYHPRDGK